jgi:hypothetical protein
MNNFSCFVGEASGNWPLKTFKTIPIQTTGIKHKATHSNSHTEPTFSYIRKHYMHKDSDEHNLWPQYNTAASSRATVAFDAVYDAVQAVG